MNTNAEFKYLLRFISII